MIEVGSFIGMAAMTKSEITIKNVNMPDLGIIPSAFKKIGVDMEIVGDDIVNGITGVDGRLEYLDFEIGEFSSSDPSDKLLCLPGEHRSAYYLDASVIFYVF